MLFDLILFEICVLLAACGFRGLRIDEVARRAGVPKSTIYRRWPSLAELAVDAVDAALGPRERPPGDDPLADLSAIIVRAHACFAASPLAASLPQLAAELTAHPSICGGRFYFILFKKFINFNSIKV